MTATTGTAAATLGARDRARAQADTRIVGMPTVPPTEWPDPPAGVYADNLTWAENVPGGRYAVKALARGTRIRLTDIAGSACAHMLLWRADAPWERLDVADTVAVMWQVYLGAGSPLLSDHGCVLATIVVDDSGHHDALCGTTTLAANIAKYGAGEVYSTSPAGRELLTCAAAKFGLTAADVGQSVSFFHGVRVAADGALESAGSAGPGKSVELVLHLPCIVAIANTAHSLDPSPTFDTGLLELLAWRTDDDLTALIADGDASPEYRRAVANSEDVHRAAR
ncbi:urea amidolyase associated protein UAAP1 [Tsukamurella ocularis]|uniref:urea amidolyase associated protein UAAP1 n=1 Tax=Tsukamurella ocularis TaxID=1970234 RepID=UPI0039F0F68B